MVSLNLTRVLRDVFYFLGLYTDVLLSCVLCNS